MKQEQWETLLKITGGELPGRPQTGFIVDSL